MFRHFRTTTNIAVLLTAGALVIVATIQAKSNERVPIAAVAEDASVIIDPTLSWDAEHIAEGDTFAVVLERLGVPYEDVLAIVATSSDVFDFTMLRAGRDLRYVFEDGALAHLAYDMDREHMVVVERRDDDFSVHREPIPYAVTTKVAAGTITTSLYEDGLASGLPETLILDFAETFAWTIDFATQVQRGDSFRVLYEERTRNGADVGIGAVLAGEFVNEGALHTAFRFEDTDEKPAYYDADGTSLVRQLLRAPLRYSHITSGYTYARFHPTIGATGPHRAIDYAAALGTPVRSVGNGTVTYAGWNGGYGNFIAVRHNDIYTTHYAHLSGYASGIRSGVTVIQGQTIGFVGSTGFSTGPHLHYEVVKRGAKINPLTLELPPGDPVPEERRAAFEAVRDRLATLLKNM